LPRAQLENQFSAPPLANLTSDKWNQGCLAPLLATPASPRFNFTADERAALQAFAATDRASLARHVPAEFFRTTGPLAQLPRVPRQLEGVPVFDILGGKLKPEWAGKFIAGEIANKPRPWLEARMPAFAKRAELLAAGLATQHGYPPQTPAEPAVDANLAKIGATLISTMPGQGFSCISCHGVGEASASLSLKLPVSTLPSRAAPAKILFPKLGAQSAAHRSRHQMPVYFDGESKSPSRAFSMATPRNNSMPFGNISDWVKKCRRLPRLRQFLG